MFEYLKNIYNQELEELNNEYEGLKNKKQTTKKQIETISELKLAKSRLKINNTNLSLTAILLLMIIVSIIGASANIVIPIILTIFTSILEIFIVKEYINMRKNLKKLYIDFMEISKKALNESNEKEYLKKLENTKSHKNLNNKTIDKVKEILENDIKQIDEQEICIINEIKLVEKSKQYIVGYELFSRPETMLYKDVKTEDEFIERSKMRFICNNLLNSYLEEKDYSEVKTHNDLGDEIKYKDKPKQIIKKI